MVAPVDGGHAGQVGLVADGGQATHRGTDRASEVRGVHRLGDVEAAQVARDVLAHMGVGEVLIELAGLGDLQDLGAQVGHDDLALDGVGLINRVLEHDVRVAGLELDLGQSLEEGAGVDLLLLDAPVVHHLAVLLSDVDVREGHAVDALDVVGAEEVHVLVVAGQLEGDVRDDDAQREGLDADLLVGVLTLGVQEPHDVGVVGVQVHGPRALAGPELVGVGEGVLQQLHDGDDAAGLVLDALDGGAHLPQVAQQEGHSPAALGQLEGGVDAAGDRLHVVLDAHEEAGDGLPALSLALVEEGGSGRLEAAGHHLVDEVEGQLLVAVGQREGHHGDTVLEALQVALPVEGLERVGRVVLEGAQEGLEAELVGVGGLEGGLDELRGVLVQDVALVVALLDQVLELLLQVVEEDRVLVDVLEEVLPGRLVVGVELDPAVRVIEVQLRVERVVVQLRGGHGLRAGVRQRVCQKFSNPSLTRATSVGVPSSS